MGARLKELAAEANAAKDLRKALGRTRQELEQTKQELAHERRMTENLRGYLSDAEAENKVLRAEMRAILTATDDFRTREDAKAVKEREDEAAYENHLAEQEAAHEQVLDGIEEAQERNLDILACDYPD